MTEADTLTLNNKDYDVSSLSEKAKYLVAQLKDLQTQMQQTRARLDQIEVASSGFTQLLEAELENPEQTDS